MPARSTLAAGITVALAGAGVLAGWLLDLSPAKSVMTGWRVMVPATAASSVFTGIAIAFCATAYRGGQRVMAARVSAALGALPPAIIFIEHLSGLRTGVEGWFGVAFDPASDVAGRMSPLTSLCFVVLDAAILAVTVPRAWAATAVRIGAGATLLVSWLAVLAVVFDTGRLADVPRFPGMAMMTIVLLAVASWATLTLSFERNDDAGTAPTRSPRVDAMLLAAFVVPLALGGISDLLGARIAPQVTTAVLAVLLAVSIAAIVWHYGTRMTELRREREDAIRDLERRVEERTQTLAAGNDELRRSQDLLRDADRRKDEFLATLAHELRNPLAPIRSAVAALRSADLADADRRDAHLIIERQVVQMSRLVDDLLDVSRITAGKLPMRKTRLLLADVIGLAVSTVRPHLDAAGHRLTLSLPPEPIAIDGDEARLSQVFANLLHNACKYTEPGGEIAIAAALVNDREVQVTVRDNGIGIPGEFLPRLFQKFSQVAPPRDRAQGGLGLGLSLVHGIVTLHGGSIEARSAGLQHGSEFVVRLPVAELPREAPAAVVPHGAAASPIARRVLVVDDNADSAEALALLLRSDGHHVETAHDGAAALVAAERFRPEAVLLDVGMPGMDGCEVCTRIRTQPWGAGILMVAQTGWGQPQDRERTRAAGFDAHLTKPVDPDVIHEMLTTLKTV